MEGNYIDHGFLTIFSLEMKIEQQCGFLVYQLIQIKSVKKQIHECLALFFLLNVVLPIHTYHGS